MVHAHASSAAGDVTPDEVALCSHSMPWANQLHPADVQVSFVCGACMCVCGVVVVVSACVYGDVSIYKLHAHTNKELPPHQSPIW
jgi:hypothetical protein